MKTQAIAIIIASASVLTASAEQYRLKIAASVDVLEGGKVVGQKRLKAGTVVEVAADEVTAKAEETKKGLADAGSLRLSNLSPVVFKNTKPAVAHVFNAEVKLENYYVGPFEGKDKEYWCVNVLAYNAKWDGRDSFYGYAKKTSAIGKRILSLLGDGEEKTMRVKISVVKHPDYDDLVNIEAIEPTVRHE